MVASGVGIHSPGEDPGTEEEALACVELALELGGDPNSMDDIGETALHGAAYRGANSIVELLIANGADTFAVENASGWTPLRIAQGVFRTATYPQLRTDGGQGDASHTSTATRLTPTTGPLALHSNARSGRRALRWSRNCACHTASRSPRRAWPRPCRQPRVATQQRMDKMFIHLPPGLAPRHTAARSRVARTSRARRSS